MNKVITLLAGGLFLIFANSSWGMDEELRSIIQRITEEKIVVWARDMVIVNAVREANKNLKMSQEEINRLDQEWKMFEGVNETIDQFLNNQCAQLLKKFQSKEVGKRTLFSEIFVMDYQGLIVAETDKTSDYWQGDEDKFIKSFNGGRGSIFIGEADFDQSTKTYSIQVSVPIFDPDTEKVIGAMTVGIELDALMEYMVDL